MRDTVNLTGVVLLVAASGESDKRLVVLTKERGKITVFARGARKPNSSLVAATNPFVFGTFSLYEGKSAYNLASVQVVHYFHELSMQQPEVYYGFYFLEFVSYYAKENEDDSEMVNLLFVALRALQNENLNNDLIRAVFELRCMAINGEYGVQENQTEDSSTKYTLEFVVSVPIQKLFSFSVSAEILGNLKEIAKFYIRRNVDREFRSLPILEIMTRENEKTQ